MSKQLVLCERLREHVARLVLNDPDSRNAMSEEMGRQFAAAIQDLRNDSSVRVVVISGAGPAFSAGGDLQMLKKKAEIDPSENIKLMLEFYNYFLCVRTLNVPVIAAINGHAIGAGLCMSLACDIRIAANNAKLGLTFVKLGLHPGMGVTYYLPKLVGHSRATELLLTGKILTSDEALQSGLVSKSVPPDQFEQTLEETINAILSGGPLSLSQLKQSLRKGEEEQLTQCLKREAECQAKNYASADFLEGVRAAIEKRAASF